MANKERGEVSVKFDGKPFVLVFDFNAMCDLEELYGKPISDLEDLFQDAEKTQMIDLRKIFWSFMRCSDENVTQRDAGRLMTQLGDDMGVIMRRVVEASFGKPEKVVPGARATKSKK